MHYTPKYIYHIEFISVRETYCCSCMQCAGVTAYIVGPQRNELLFGGRFSVQWRLPPNVVLELELSWSKTLSVQLLISKIMLEVVLLRLTCFTSHLQWDRSTHRVNFYVHLTNDNKLPQGLLFFF